jgi:drug/metabolite transporter (DMT)-like permease
MNPRRIAIGLMVAQAALFSAETAAIHCIGAKASVMQLAFLRAAGGVVLALALGWRTGLNVALTHQPMLQLVRGAVTLLYMWVMICSFAWMPFADATAISYTQSAYIALFSVLILGETVTRARWAAATIGIVGALLIAKPAFAGWNVVYFVALAGTSLNGLAFVLNRYLQREDSEATTMFYTNVVAMVGNVPVLVTGGVPRLEVLPLLPCVAILGPLGMYAGIVAVRHASASALGPYTLLRLVIGVAGGVVVFYELPDLLSSLGALVILASCLLSSGLLPRLRAKREPLAVTA